MDNPQVKYQLLEPNDDYRKAIIEKEEWGKVRFSIEDVEKYQNKYSEMKRTLAAQAEIEKAKMDNVISNHPFVKDMSEEDRFTVWFYMDAKKKFDDNEKQIDELLAALKEYADEKEVIMEQLGFVKTDA